MRDDEMATDYTRLVIERLAQITGLPLSAARNRFAATQSLGDFVALSGALRGIAVDRRSRPLMAIEIKKEESL